MKALRIFFCDDDGVVKRIPFKWYDELYLRHSARALPEYAGKVIRCAEFCVELEKRKPVRIVSGSFSLLVFDAAGCLDKECRAAYKRAVVTAMENPAAARGLHDEFHWSPTEEESYKLERLALGQGTEFP